MYERGAVVVATDPYGNTPRRPYLVLSDETHPFAGSQYIAVGITTKEYAPSLPLDGAFVRGTLREPSFVSPWAVVSLRAADIDRAVAMVEQTITETAAKRMAGFAGTHRTDS